MGLGVELGGDGREKPWRGLGNAARLGLRCQPPADLGQVEVIMLDAGRELLWLRRKLEGRQIRVAGVEAVAGLEGGDTVTPKMPLHAQSLNQFTTERKEGGKETKTGKKKTQPR